MTRRLDPVIGGAALAGAATLATKAIERRRRPLRTKQVMSTPAVTVDADASAVTAAATLASSGVGILPVCDGDGRPVGVVTDRDLVVRGLSSDDDQLHAPVRELAETGPVTVSADLPVAETAGVMSRHGIRRIPVMAGGRIVGVVSRGDLIGHLPRRTVRALHRIGRETPSRDSRSGRWLFKRAYA